MANVLICRLRNRCCSLHFAHNIIINVSAEKWNDFMHFPYKSAIINIMRSNVDDSPNWNESHSYTCTNESTYKPYTPFRHIKILLHWKVELNEYMLKHISLAVPSFQCSRHRMLVNIDKHAIKWERLRYRWILKINFLQWNSILNSWIRVAHSKYSKYTDSGCEALFDCYAMIKWWEWNCEKCSIVVKIDKKTTNHFYIMLRIRCKRYRRLTHSRCAVHSSKQFVNIDILFCWCTAQR